MARQNVNTGTTANDGSGDTLRAGAQKINQNFIELYSLLGGDSAQITDKVSFGDSGVVFNGVTYNTTLGWVEGSSDFTIKVPSSGSTLVGDTTAQTLTNKTLTSAVLTTPQFNDTSADHQYVVAVSELAADRTVTLPLLASNDTFVFAAHTQTLTNKTITNGTLINARVRDIVDSNGSNLLHFTKTASAVNHIDLANAATGGSPSISTHGTDTDINLQLGAQGAGFVDFQSNIRFRSETIVVTAQTILLDRPLTLFDPTTDIDATLPDGRQVGEIKYLVNEASSSVTVTPTNFANGTSFTMRSNALTHLLWSGAKWHLHIDQNYNSSNTDAFIYVTA